MGLIEEGSLGDLGGVSEAQIKADVTKEIVKNIFSDDDAKIIQNTQFDRAEMPGVFALELVNHFLIKRFCHDKFLRTNFQEAINRLYQSRVSLDRQGRKELLESLKTETLGMTFGLGGQRPETVK